MTASELFREARQRSGLSQTQVVRALAEAGVSIRAAALSHYETGRRFPPPRVLYALCGVYGVQAEFFLAQAPTRRRGERLRNASAEAEAS